MVLTVFASSEPSACERLDAAHEFHIANADKGLAVPRGASSAVGFSSVVIVFSWLYRFFKRRFGMTLTEACAVAGLALVMAAPVKTSVRVAL
jgi:hypothetical protein